MKSAASSDGAPPASASAARAPRPWRRRLGALALGLLLVPIAVEGALWVASLFAKPEARLVELAPRPGERRILCIGDSHTYGSHLEPEDAYPGQLQAFLDRAPGNPWKVINLGYPGQNSAEVRLRLARNIAVYKPEIVICWVGANNTWSLEQSHLWDHPHEEVPAPIVRDLAQRLRVVGLVRMIVRRWNLAHKRDPGLLEVERDAEAVPGLDGAMRGGGVGAAPPPIKPTGYITPDAEVRRGLFVDLARMLELSRAQGATLVLSEYPVALPETRKTINKMLREFSNKNGCPFVAIARVIVPLGERLGFERVWFADHHCNALGNYEVARTMLMGLMSVGLVEKRQEYLEILPVEATLVDGGLTLVGRVGDRVELELFGPPSASFRISVHLLLGGPGEEPVPFHASASRALFTPEQRAASNGKLSSTGRAHVSLTLPARERSGELGVPADFNLWGWRLGVTYSGLEEDSGPLREINVKFAEWEKEDR